MNPTVPACDTCTAPLTTHCPSLQCDLWRCKACGTVQTKDGRLKFLDRAVP